MQVSRIVLLGVWGSELCNGKAIWFCSWRGCISMPNIVDMRSITCMVSRCMSISPVQQDGNTCRCFMLVSRMVKSLLLQDLSTHPNASLRSRVKQHPSSHQQQVYPPYQQSPHPVYRASKKAPRKVTSPQQQQQTNKPPDKAGSQASTHPSG